MIGYLRRRLDARTLRRAADVFTRRGWVDAPGRAPVVAGTVAHLRYRVNTLRERP